MDNNLQEQTEKFYKGLPITKYNDIDPFKAGYLAALSAQSSNSSDKEVDEDLVKQMEDAMNDVLSVLVPPILHEKDWDSDDFPVCNTDEAAAKCASIAQSLADKQSMEFAEWVEKKARRVWQRDEWSIYGNAPVTTVELLTIFKESKS